MFPSPPAWSLALPFGALLIFLVIGTWRRGRMAAALKSSSRSMWAAIQMRRPIRMNFTAGSCRVRISESSIVVHAIGFPLLFPRDPATMVYVDDSNRRTGVRLVRGRVDVTVRMWDWEELRGELLRTHWL